MLVVVNQSRLSIIYININIILVNILWDKNHALQVMMSLNLERGEGSFQSFTKNIKKCSEKSTESTVMMISLSEGLVRPCRLYKQKFKESGASCLSRDSVAQITRNDSIDRQDAGVAEEEAQLGAEVLAGGRHGGRQVRHSLLPVSVSRGNS